MDVNESKLQKWNRISTNGCDALWFNDLIMFMRVCVCVALCAKKMCLLRRDRRGRSHEATTIITSAVDPMQRQVAANRPGPYSGGMGSMGRLYWKLWSLRGFANGKPMDHWRLWTIMIYQWIYCGIIFMVYQLWYHSKFGSTMIYLYIVVVPQHFGQTHASMAQKLRHETATLRACAQVKRPADGGWFCSW